ncbi:HGGxSTG domain-containing protein [Legionella bozemanae]|uniref:HGGxSTG domain-containing protein n=1 Tax=Legionella bozemanae TaxID=447 RepID=UPI0035BC8A45
MAKIYFDEKLNICFSITEQPKLSRKFRSICGAKTRKNTSCQAPPVWNKVKDCAVNGRCKLHGGLSTGPRTEAGRDRIRKSNRRRKITI